jgi:adenylate cyclase
MSEKLPEINQAWASQLQGPLSVGIGIHTGPARVGNVGSSFKFKYGPLGNTVNLASRVQGVNKYLNTQMLLTRSTYDSVGARLNARRLGKVRVHNIQEPVELFEALPDHQVALPSIYEQALTLFETKSFAQAAGVLGRMLSEYPNDGPTLVLLSRTVQGLVSGPDKEHPVLVLESK